MDEVATLGEVINQVWSLVTQEALLWWLLGVLVVGVVGAVIGKLVGDSLKWALALASGALGAFILFQIVKTLF